MNPFKRKKIIKGMIQASQLSLISQYKKYSNLLVKKKMEAKIQYYKQQLPKY